MLVRQFLERSAARLPEKVALVSDGQRFTYAEIDTMANRLANALVASGILPGERVVIFLPNSVAAVVAIFGVLKAGGVFVVINHSTKRERLNYILENSTASALITEASKSALAQELFLKNRYLKLIVLSPSRPNNEQGISAMLDFDHIQIVFSDKSPPCRNIDLDLACLIYTSGSTGKPKGVMCDHSNVNFVASSIISYLQNVETDIVINALPLSFDYGLYQLLMVFMFGGTLVLERSFTYPAVILKRIEDERVTGLPGVPTIFAILLQLDLSEYDFSSLRYITNTAAALPTRHIQELRKKFPRAMLYSMYGLTETKRALYLPPEQLAERPDSVGIAIPGTQVWLEDRAGNRLGPGQTGELVVRGRHVMRGYWGDPEATMERFRPGLFPGERVCHTGDLFRMDLEGYLYFVAREDDIIKCGGEKVSPKEVENIICNLAGVMEVVVVGMPDPLLGQAIKAYVVVSDSGLKETDILAYCRANMENFMVPKFIEICRDLPQTASGKIKKLELT